VTELTLSLLVSVRDATLIFAS